MLALLWDLSHKNCRARKSIKRRSHNLFSEFSVVMAIAMKILVILILFLGTRVEFSSQEQLDNFEGRVTMKYPFRDFVNWDLVRHFIIFIFILWARD